MPAWTRGQVQEPELPSGAQQTAQAGRKEAAAARSSVPWWGDDGGVGGTYGLQLASSPTGAFLAPLLEKRVLSPKGGVSWKKPPEGKCTEVLSAGPDPITPRPGPAQPAQRCALPYGLREPAAGWGPLLDPSAPRTHPPMPLGLGVGWAWKIRPSPA